MRSTVLVTGASGNVGQTVVQQLRQLGDTVRPASEKGFDYLLPASWPAALAGVDRVFLLLPPGLRGGAQPVCSFVQAARRAGVRTLVAMSVLGAERMRWVPHWTIEQALRAGPTDWTVLRPGFFSQNLHTAYRQDVCEDGRIYVPAGAAQVAFVDTRDVGAVAACVLADPGRHRGRTLALTGDRTWTFAQLAGLVSAQLDCPVAYQPAGAAAYAWHLAARRRLPLVQVAVQTVLHLGLRRGDGAPVTDTIAEVLGRSPTPLPRSVADIVHGWQTAAPAAGAGK